MKTDVNIAPKKRAGRKYQFDPQDVSMKFHLLEDHVRDRIVRQRAELKKKHKEDREARRSLFKLLTETRESFIPPESKDEADTRALSLNSQIVMRTTMKNALLSLLNSIETAKSKLEEPEPSCFSTDPATTVEEAEEERKALETLREIRSSAFLSELLERSKADRIARQQRLEDILNQRLNRSAEEAAEEADTLLASDRKLVISGAYRHVSRS